MEIKQSDETRVFSALQRLALRRKKNKRVQIKGTRRELEDGAHTANDLSELLLSALYEKIKQRVACNKLERKKKNPPLQPFRSFSK